MGEVAERAKKCTGENEEEEGKEDVSKCEVLAKKGAISLTQFSRICSPRTRFADFEHD